MKHNDYLQQQPIVINPETLRILKDISSVLGLLMNTLYLFNAKRKYHYLLLDVPEWVTNAIKYLGYMQGASSLILIYFYAINRKEIIIQKAWRDYVKWN